MTVNEKLREFCELFVFQERISSETDKVLLNVLDEGEIVNIMFCELIFKLNEWSKTNAPQMII